MYTPQVLSAADLCFLACTLVLYPLSSSLLSRPSICKVTLWLRPGLYWLRLTNTWLTVLLTADRYVAVCRPLQATHRYTGPYRPRTGL